MTQFEFPLFVKKYLLTFNLSNSQSSSKCSSTHFFFRIAIEPRNQAKTYNEILRDTEAFRNPAIVENLYIEGGLKPGENYSLMSSSKGKYAPDEYAKDLRQLQASKLAFR